LSLWITKFRLIQTYTDVDYISCCKNLIVIRSQSCDENINDDRLRGWRWKRVRYECPQHLRQSDFESIALSTNYVQNSPRFLQPLNRWHCIAKSSLILVCLKHGRCLAYCLHPSDCERYSIWKIANVYIFESQIITSLISTLRVVLYLANVILNCNRCSFNKIHNFD